MNSNFQSSAGYVFLSSTWGIFYPRTSKHFSRCPVDLTLEQTVNRDAASRHTGSFHGFKKGSKTIWTITFSTRGTIVGKLLWVAGLSNLEEASQESKSYRIIRDNRDVEEVITALRSTMNPFNAEGRPTGNAKFYHLSSGRAASNDMKDDLINVVSIRVLHHVHGQTNFGKSVKKIQPGKKGLKNQSNEEDLKFHN